MKNHLNNELLINIISYRKKNSYNKLYDSDWLKAELIIVNDGNTFKTPLNFLIIIEIERIIQWLNDLEKPNETIKTLEFIDPKMKLKLMTRSNMKVLKLVYETNSNMKECWELIINSRNISILKQEFQDLLTKYPCRCNLTH
jgi:hypothetical protein